MRRIYTLVIIAFVLAVIAWFGFGKTAHAPLVSENEIEIPHPSLTYQTTNKTVLAIAEEVKVHLDNRDYWLQLAIDLKNADLYRSAEEVLLYTTTRWPADFVAFNNLGDLYQTYLKDYPKAERAHKTTILLNSHNIQSYINLSDLYRLHSTGQEKEAVSILEQGLRANPGNTQLTALLKEVQGD